MTDAGGRASRIVEWDGLARRALHPEISEERGRSRIILPGRIVRLPNHRSRLNGQIRLNDRPEYIPESVTLSVNAACTVFLLSSSGDASGL